MAESQIHLFMKNAVSEALRNDDFMTYMEPDTPPFDSVTWGAYRPDVLGVKHCDSFDAYAFAECETKPRINRILAKKTASIIVQSRLLKRTQRRLILAIPSGTLKILDMQVRRWWEIWIVNKHSGIVSIIEKVN
jgi:hypothetical protein